MNKIIDRDSFQQVGSVTNGIVSEVARQIGKPFHAPGIYFDMPDSVYHADPALGSTGLKKLLASAPDFWWQSSMNPAREPEKETEAKVFGRAVHKCVLEGRDAFEAEFAPQPAPEDYPCCLRVVDDLKRFLKQNRLAISGSKAELIARAKTVPGCPVVFDDVVDVAAASGKTLLKRDDFNRILAASAFIKANDNLANAFTGGMPEVSIFWEADGVRLKARLDYLKMNAISDLKSIRNSREIEFKVACRNRIASLNYLLSAEHYCEGRRQMSRLIADGAVYGDHDAEWLRGVAKNQAYAFVLVFWQAEASPISHGFKLSPGNPLFANARAEIARSIDIYQSFMREFGTDTAWILKEPLEELDQTELPNWWHYKQSFGA